MRAEGADVVAAKLEHAARTSGAAARGIARKHANQMADQIRSTAPSERVQESVTVDSLWGNATGGGIVFGPTHPLSHLLEFGTGPRWQKKTGRYTGVMPPSPYVQPVTERGIPAYVDEMRRTLGSLP
jgi:hypothetical protein